MMIHLLIMLARAREWRRLDELIARDLWVRHQVDDVLCDEARDRLRVLRALHELLDDNRMTELTETSQ